MDKRISDLFTIIRPLGKGGSAVVYLAEHNEFHTLWALKQVHKEGSISYAIMTEHEILKNLSHPMLPHIIDVFEDEDYIYIAEEYIQGPNLHQYVADHGPITSERAVQWLYDLCDVLQYLHEQKPYPIIYRDLKPDNIILCTDGTLRLIDFGIARFYKGDDRTDTLIAGTRGYAAPEQMILHARTDTRSDIYALGITMNYLLTGKKTLAMSEERLPQLQIAGDISDGLEYIIWKCTRSSAEERYGSVFEIREDLDQINPRKIKTEHEDKKNTKHRWKTVILVIALLISAGLTAYGGFRIKKEREAYEAAVAEKARLEAEAREKAEQDERYRNGIKAFNEGNYKQAVMLLEQVLESDPQRNNVYMLLGDSYAELASGAETLKEAEAFYDEAQKHYEAAQEAGDENANDRLKELGDRRTERKNKEQYSVLAAELYNALEKKEYDKILEIANHTYLDVFTQMLQELEENQNYYLYTPQESDKVLAVFRGGSLYYGEWEDGKRSGWGMWYCANQDKEYRFEGMWDDDLPNGEGIIQEYTHNSPEGSSELYPTLVEERGEFTDGYHDGEFSQIWYMSDESVRTFEPILYEKGVSHAMTRDEIYEWYVTHNYPAFQAAAYADEDIERCEDYAKVIGYCIDTKGRTYSLQMVASAIERVTLVHETMSSAP